MALYKSQRLITHASSLGMVESLIERRAQYCIDASRSTPPSLISVGLEYVEYAEGTLRVTLHKVWKLLRGVWHPVLV